MKITNIYYIFFIFFYCLVSCKDSRKHKSINNKSISDTTIVINKIDSSKIQKNLNIDKEKIIELFFNSFSKDNQPNYVVFDQVKYNHDRINVKKYEDLEIYGMKYPTYLISFRYENDAPYQSIFLANKKNNDGLILFEKVVNEGEYIRISKITKNKITNTQYAIEYYEYDEEGNIKKEKEKKDSTVIISNIFEITNGIISLSLPQKRNGTKSISSKWYGIYKVWFDYGKIGGVNAGWELKINIDKAVITASGNGYQIGFTDQLEAVEEGNKLILRYKKNIDGYSLGENMNPEFLLIEDNGKYYIQSEWVDSDILTKAEKNGYKISKE